MHNGLPELPHQSVTFTSKLNDSHDLRRLAANATYFQWLDDSLVLEYGRKSDF